jgi:hypothetical protein
MSAASRPSASAPCGVPLHELCDALRADGLEVAVEGDELVAVSEMMRTRVQVTPPPSGSLAQGPAARAIVRVRAEIHVARERGDEPSEFAAALNHLAMLGASRLDGERLGISSRLSIFEGEEHAWRKLHLPLLVASVRAPENISKIGRERRDEDGESSPWSGTDFLIVEKHLAPVSVCFADDANFSAEFGLSPGAHSAAAGDHDTALLQLNSDIVHPLVGHGLALRLTMPTQIGEIERVRATCEQLNQRELDTIELPPHFGAWCPSEHEGYIAYHAFLPPELHGTAPNIAVNLAFWSLLRARWASGELEGLADTP